MIKIQLHTKIGLLIGNFWYGQVFLTIKAESLYFWGILFNKFVKTVCPQLMDSLLHQKLHFCDVVGSSCKLI
nr:unnamed protein product [Callosobruchus chinensis]